MYHRPAWHPKLPALKWREPLFRSPGAVFDDLWPPRAENEGRASRLRDLLVRFSKLKEAPLLNFPKGLGDDFAKALFELPHFQFPAVLLTTSDRTADQLATEFVSFLKPGLSRYEKLLGKSAFDDELKKLEHQIESQIILRRFDISSATAAVPRCHNRVFAVAACRSSGRCCLAV